MKILPRKLRSGQWVSIGKGVSKKVAVSAVAASVLLGSGIIPSDKLPSFLRPKVASATSSSYDYTYSLSGKTFTVTLTVDGESISQAVTAPLTAGSTISAYQALITTDIEGRFQATINYSYQRLNDTKYIQGTPLTIDFGYIGRPNAPSYSGVPRYEASYANITFTGPKNIYYSLDNGATWNLGSSVRVIENGTVLAKAINSAKKESPIVTIPITTIAMDKPTFKLDKVIYTNSNVTVTINYPEQAVIKEYSIDGGTTWKPYTEPVVITENLRLYARATDRHGVSTIGNDNITNIDRVPPKAPTISGSRSSGENIQVTITKDPTAYRTYYKIGENGAWTEYNYVPFIVEPSGTIYAYSNDVATNVSTISSLDLAELGYTFAYSDAEQAVTMALNNRTQEDIDKARVLVSKLKESDQVAFTDKLDKLQAELDYSLKVSNATAAVVKAESSKTQADVDAARTLVNELQESDQAPLNERLDAVQAAIDAAAEYAKKVAEATAAVATAEQTKTQADVDAARTLVNELQESDQAPLNERLDVVQAAIDAAAEYAKKVAEATAAVATAEQTKAQADVDAARTLVNELQESDRSPLIERLDAVQAAIDAAANYAKKVAEATAAVENAEQTKLQADVDAARALVNELQESDRAPLNARLDAVQAEIDTAGEYAKKVAEATAAVVTAETSQLQEDLDAARVLVNELEESDRGPLNTRLDMLQSIIDENKNLALVIEAVKKAENSQTQADVDAAREAVAQLADGAYKTSLNNRLDAVQSVIDAVTAEKQQIEEATAALEKAEQTKKYADLTAAKSLISALTPSVVKNQLIERMQKLQVEISLSTAISEATKAVTRAESSKLKVDYDEAVARVSPLPEGDTKTSLQNRLAAVKATIDENDAEGLRLVAATAAVERAEKSLRQTDYDSALVLVEALKASADKTALNKRLTAVKNAITEQGLVVEGLAVAETTEDSVTLIWNKLEGVSSYRLERVLNGEVIKTFTLPANSTKYRDYGLTSNTEYEYRLSGKKDSVFGAPATITATTIVDYGLQVTTATESVEKAEKSLLQADVDAARVLVNNLKEEDQPALHARLDAVQTIIDGQSSDDKQLAQAKAAVEKAEQSLTQADVDAARTLVNALQSESDKTGLNARLDAVESFIHDLANAATATAAVEKAEKSQNQNDVTAARTLVAALSDGAIKTALTNRIDAVQAIIDQLAEADAQVQAATNAVVTAETTKKQTDINAAKTLVNALPTSVVKNNLLARLQTVQVEANVTTAISNAKSAVTRAERSGTQAAYDEAMAYVTPLPDDETKTALLERLAAVKAKVDEAAAYDQTVLQATALVEKAERSVSQIDYDNALAAVTALKTSSEKTALTKRLNVVRDALTKQILNVSGFTVTTNTKDTITLAWDLNPEATGYRLERVLDGQVVKTYNLSSKQKSYKDYGLSLNTEYTYRLMAKSGSVLGNPAELQASTYEVSIPDVPTLDDVSVDDDGILHVKGNGQSRLYLVVKDSGGSTVTRSVLTAGVEKTYTFTRVGTYEVMIESYNTTDKVSTYSEVQSVEVKDYMVEAPTPEDVQYSVAKEGDYVVFRASVANNVDGKVEKYSFEVFDATNKRLNLASGKVVGERIEYSYKRAISNTPAGTYTISVKGKRGTSTFSTAVVHEVTVE